MSDVWIMLKTWQQLERLNACDNEGKMKAKDHVVNVHVARVMAAPDYTGVCRGPPFDYVIN